MKLRSTLTLSAVGLAMIYGCGGNGTDNPNAGKRQPAIQNAQNAGAQGANPQKAIIPDDARYTIACAAFAGAGHEQQAKLTKETLVAQTGRTDFWLNHEPDRSSLMFGYYRAISHETDPAEASRLDQDQKFLKSIKNNMNQPMFRSALVISLPTPDPVAPPEYNLMNLDRDKPLDEPSRRFWTVVVAAYTSDARGEKGEDRKQLAVDAVLAARAKGIPAYYYHGETISQVCIGAWPRSAVKEQERSNAISSSEAKANSGESVVVATGGLTPSLAQKLQERGDVKVFQPKIEILDPDMLRTLQSYPEYSVNGEVKGTYITDPVTHRKTLRRQPSFMTQIPVNQPSLLTGGGAADQAPAPGLLNPNAPSGPSGGRLRQIER